MLTNTTLMKKTCKGDPVFTKRLTTNGIKFPKQKSLVKVVFMISLKSSSEMTPKNAMTDKVTTVFVNLKAISDWDSLAMKKRLMFLMMMAMNPIP